MNNPVLDAIADRRSIRSYKNEKITAEQIDILLKAAQQSPSARNAQPWHFTVLQNPEIFAEINAETAKVLGQEAKDIFNGAPLTIFISCDASYRWGRIDCGIAVQTIALAAHSIGLGSVILGRPDHALIGPRADYFRKRLKFPDSYDFAVAIAIGVPAGTKDAHPVEPDRISFAD